MRIFTYIILICKIWICRGGINLISLYQKIVHTTCAIPGNNAELLTVCPPRQCQSEAMLEGVRIVALSPEISTGKTVGIGPWQIHQEHANMVLSSFPQGIVDIVKKIKGTSDAWN